MLPQMAMWLNWKCRNQNKLKHLKFPLELRESIFGSGSGKRRELVGATQTCHVSWFTITSSVGASHKEIYRYKEDVKYVKGISGRIKLGIWKEITERWHEKREKLNYHGPG